MILGCLARLGNLYPALEWISDDDRHGFVPLAGAPVIGVSLLSLWRGQSIKRRRSRSPVSLPTFPKVAARHPGPSLRQWKGGTCQPPVGWHLLGSGPSSSPGERRQRCRREGDARTKRRVVTHGREIAQFDTEEAVRTRIVSRHFQAHANSGLANQAQFYSLQLLRKPRASRRLPARCRCLRGWHQEKMSWANSTNMGSKRLDLASVKSPATRAKEREPQAQGCVCPVRGTHSSGTHSSCPVEGRDAL